MKIDKEFYSKLLTLIVPIAFQNFMVALVGASDAIMLGFLKQSALSAVSLASQIQFIHSLFVISVVIGMTILVAQYWGKENVEAMSNIFSYALKITIGCSIVFSALAFFIPNVLMRLFTPDTELILLGGEYLRVVSFSYLASGIAQIYLCMLKNIEQATKSTFISAIVVIINIGLNLVLIFGWMGIPKLGIKGAAIATLIAKIIECIWSIIALRNNRVNIRYVKRIHKGYALKSAFWKYTYPVLFNEIIWGGGFTMISVIMGRLGSDAVAANGIANVAKNIIVCISLGIGSGGSILIGNKLGKGELQKARLYGRKLIRLSIVSGTLSGLFLIAIRPIILNYSTLSDDANYYLSAMLFICGYYLIGKSVNSTVIGGIFCAGGDTKFGLLCDLITMWCIIIPIGVIAAFWLKVPILVVYFILNLDEIIKLPAVYWRYRQYKWVKDLTI